MKKTINTALIALTVAIALHGTANAKILRQRTIPVTKSTKDLFIDTKNLKASTSPEELKQNIQKVATDSKKDPYIRLKNEEMVLLDEIKNKEAEISGLEGYSGMFFLDSDELMEARNERADLYKELYEVQAKLDKTREKQPVIETKIKDWAFYTLIATVGLAVADQVITGGEGRKALMSGVSTVGGKIGSAAKTTWSSMPSFRSTTPSPEITSNVGEAVAAATTSAASTWGQTVSNAAEAAKKLVLKGAMAGASGFIGYKVQTIMTDLEEAQKNPSAITPEQLQKKISELKYLLDEFNTQNLKK